MPRLDPTIPSPTSSDVTVRIAGDGDAVVLARLAALDSAAMPVAPALLAEVGGEAVAALPVAGGAAVADPFRRTTAALQLLELRAAQIRAHGRGTTTPASSRRRLLALIRGPRRLSLR